MDFNSIKNALEQNETPFYFYDLSLLKRTLESIKKESESHSFNVHYALKANSNNKILDLIKEYGLGADCVSGNEIYKAMEIGFENQKIMFAGVGKTDQEIDFALEKGIFCFNCESIAEIEVIQQIAKKKRKTAKIAIRINPNVVANTHHYITTGIEENKFGINKWELEEVVETINNSDSIVLIGLHFHIGSQITDLAVYKNLCVRVNEFQEWFEQRNINVSHINVGGGLGIDYSDPLSEPMSDFKSYFKLFKDHLELRANQQLHFELGRSIVGQCGSLVSKVLYIKKGIKTKFAIIDAGMTELIRPALYQASHQIINISSEDKNTQKYDVVGPICESSDCFGKQISLPTTVRGDCIVILSSGAYGQVMSSQYNLRELVTAVYSKTQ